MVSNNGAERQLKIRAQFEGTGALAG